MKQSMLIMGLCATLLNVGCNAIKEEKEEDVKFLVTSPLLKDTSVLREYVSQIHAIQHIELRALEKGYLDYEIDPTLDLVAEINRLKKEADSNFIYFVIINIGNVLNAASVKKRIIQISLIP